MLYEVITLDIMMPEMDGQEALKRIRDIEDKAGIPYKKRAKIMMTTALGDVKTVMGAFSYNFV